MNRRGRRASLDRTRACRGRLCAMKRLPAVLLLLILPCPVLCRGPRQEGVGLALQREGPRRLGAEDHRLRGRRELRRHLPGRERRAQGLLRQVRHVRRALRPPLLQDAVLALRDRGRVPLRGRAGEGRPRLGVPQQRGDDPRPGGRDDEEGPGLSDLDRGAAARWPRRRQRALDGEPVHAGNERGDERRSSRRATASTRRRRRSTATSGCASRSRSTAAARSCTA